MNNIPLYVAAVFIATTGLTCFFLYKSKALSRGVWVIVSCWLVLQAILARTGFYTLTDTIPPRFVLAVGPPILLILSLFLFPALRPCLDGWKIRWLTWLHVVRIPVELVLFWLFQHGQVPQLMTFEGNNPDILSGISAPLIAWLAFRGGSNNRRLLIGWNLVCLMLLFNIVVRAILAAPTPFQLWGFEQPNVGVLYFPYIWLPAFIVPVVLLAHLAALRQLLRPGSLKPDNPVTKANS